MGYRKDSFQVDLKRGRNHDRLEFAFNLALKSKTKQTQASRIFLLLSRTGSS